MFSVGDSISWGSLSILASCIIVSSGIVLAVYKELSKLREDINLFRVEIAKEYVTFKALSDVNSKIERLEERLNDSIGKLTERFDKLITLFTDQYGARRNL